MSESEVNKLLKQIGHSTFIEFYLEFDLHNKGIKEHTAATIFNGKSWTTNSKNSKFHAGKTIFSRQLQKQALEIIISNKSDKKTISTALEIFNREYPNEDVTKIKFIRNAVVFGEEIINKLFQGYEIISEKSVGPYKLDWYIPELNLAIEYDESHHRRYEEEDKLRQQFIENTLDCKFLRFKE